MASNGSRGGFHPYRDAHGRFAATPKRRNIVRLYP